MDMELLAAWRAFRAAVPEFLNRKGEKMKHKEKVAIAVAAILSATTGLASAADSAMSMPYTSKSGYVVDSSGNLIHNGTGLCVRTGYFTKDRQGFLGERIHGSVQSK